LRFVFRTENKSRKVGAALEIIDDYPFDLRLEGSQDACKQIMGERPLLLCVPCMNIAIAAPTLCSMQITKTFSSLPRKTAQLPLVVATARTCTWTTGLFIIACLSLAFPSRA